jgi:hypothetical protein
MLESRLSLWALRLSSGVVSSTALFIVLSACVSLSMPVPAVAHTEVLLSKSPPAPAPVPIAPPAPTAAPVSTSPVPALAALASEEPPVVPRHFGFARAFDIDTFQRGNVHAHSNESDGDSDPRSVYLWYRNHGYNFAAVTDHNVFVDPARYRDLERDDFALLGGEEVTMKGAGRPVHINALCTGQKIAGGTFDTAEAAIASGVERVLAVGGIPLVNHPNFDWGIDEHALFAARGATLIEIFSGHPSVPGAGDRHHPSHEAMWDSLLTSGRDVMGVAVDDAHHLHPQNDAQSQPGRAWIEVFAPSAKRDLICAAIGNGLLYASNGAKIDRIAVSTDAYEVWPAAAGTVVEFLGDGGRVLAMSSTSESGQRVTYRTEGAESYVRARVLDGDGKRAWTPPVRVTSL